MEIVVNDTNIFIDLCKLQILAEAFESSLSMHTTDFVIAELKDAYQRSEVMGFVRKGKLKIHSFSPEELAKVVAFYSNAGGNVSLTDCSAWYYAMKNGYTLLTGDGQLRRKAIASKVAVHGLLYLVDIMVSENIVEPEFAAKKLIELLTLNNRMPKKEIEERIRRWLKCT